MKKVLLLLIISLYAKWITAQQDLTIYYMDNVPQRMYQNPAFKPNSNFNIGLPAISSIYLDHINTVATPKMLFDTKGVSPILTTNKFKRKIGKNNYLGINAKVDLLSFGFKIKKNYFSFNATENVFFRLNIPKGMLLLPLTGNAKFEEHNGELSFKNFGVNMSHYREYGLGWQKEWNDKLNVGIKVKYLYGMENIYTKKSDYKWTTSQDEWNWNLSGQMDVRTAGLPLDIYRDANGNLTSKEEKLDIANGDIKQYFFKRNNYGVGLDLGADYKLNDKISVNASIIDLGFIQWAQYNENFKTKDANFLFTGMDFTEAIYSPDSLRSNTIDSLRNAITTDLENQTSLEHNANVYNTPLLTRIHLGGTYQLYKKEKSGGKAGILFQSEIYQHTIRPSVTLSYNQTLGRWLNASVSYSVINRSWENVGAGLSLNLGALQIYAVADNLLAGRLTKFTDNGNKAFMYPTSSKNTQIHTGINFTFGRKKKDRDKDGIIDKKDDCPDVFGLSIFNGCPDTDADGVPDKDDACPETPGKVNGCPDTDEDGIIDKEDDCPEIAGLSKFNGCPDTDEDGIMDKKDNCPKIAGLAKFKGCPDTDKDGIMDKEDNCPDQFGPKENNGCPWGDKDKDGVMDNVDKCPTVFGVKENNGCPHGDKDKDGILDKDDKCPNVPGVKENNGCPKIEKKEEEILKRAFENLEFENGKDVIKQTSFSSLNELAEILNKKKTWKLGIAGHTDAIGSASGNLNLSKRRALSVKKYLENKGIAADRLRAKWFGETKPIAPNNTPEGRQRNRRVEMNIQFE